MTKNTTTKNEATTEEKENTMNTDTITEATTTEATTTEEKKPALKLSEVITKYATITTAEAIRARYNIPDGTVLNPVTYAEALEKPWRLYGSDYLAIPVTYIVALDNVDSVRYQVSRELNRVAKSKDTADIIEAINNAADIVHSAGVASRVVVPDDEATKADYYRGLNDVMLDIQCAANSQIQKYLEAVEAEDVQSRFCTVASCKNWNAANAERIKTEAKNAECVAGIDTATMTEEQRKLFEAFKASMTK